MSAQSQSFDNSASFARKLDERDSLKHFRERFYMPKQANGEDVLYFTGNSLGLQPKTTRAYIDQELKDWETFGVEGHFHAKNPWMPYHEFLTGQMAEVVGAKPLEVVVMNSLTVNLHLLMVSFYRPAGKRRKIVIEKGAFPSDQYAVQSQIRFHQTRESRVESREWRDTSVPPASAGGFSSHLIELTPRESETILRTEDILSTIRQNGDEIALILLGGVNYYTGQAFDFEAITRAGHEAGG
jgi:kynureninase